LGHAVDLAHHDLNVGKQRRLAQDSGRQQCALAAYAGKKKFAILV